MAVAVDVGATYLRVGIGGEDGNFLYKRKERTIRSGGERAVAEQIIRMVKEAPPELLKDVYAVGVGTIGPLSMREGVVIKPANLAFEKIVLRKPVEEAFDRAAYVVNDCVAAVWGERNYGQAKGCDNVVYLTVSTGIGAGVIVDGHLLLGKDGNAHEVGHLVVDMDGRMTCGCGKLGHWEAYCSGANMANYAKYLLENRAAKKELLKGSLLHEALRNGTLTAKLTYEAAKEGDELALQIVDEISKINAMGLASIVNLYDPELVIVGGSVALKNPDLVIRPMERYLENYLINRKPKIVKTSLGDDVVLKGALAVALNPPEDLTRWLAKFKQ